MQKFALIVAGGSGQRMQSDTPKQFLPLNDLPVLMHTLRAFDFDDIQIHLVLPKHQTQLWQELVEQYDFDVPHQVVSGGETRFHSVQNGLQTLRADDGLVTIHDGVRPMISRKIIRQSYDTAEELGNAVTAVSLKDSIRKMNEKHSSSLSREQFRLIQTPQTFQLSLIKKAFQQPYQSTFTDDASVFEAAGHNINLIIGDYRNLKITTPDDMIVAESFLKA